jgi:hypothetical protein
VAPAETTRFFLEALAAAAPYRIVITLTDNGIQIRRFAKEPPGPTAKLRGHPFDRI